MSNDPALIVQFLAQNDVACPSCGYSLRGCAQPCCPECGEEIRLSLRGESGQSLHTALRYILWALFGSAIATCFWMIGMSIYYSASGPFGILGLGWYLRTGISAAGELAIGTLCLIALRRLNTNRASQTFHSIATLGVWIAILVVANLIASVLLGFA